MSSPHKRGFSPNTPSRGIDRFVVPAQAGVFLSICMRAPLLRGRPRTSGGFPGLVVALSELSPIVPAQAGVSRLLGSALSTMTNRILNVPSMLVRAGCSEVISVKVRRDGAAIPLEYATACPARYVPGRPPLPV